MKESYIMVRVSKDFHNELKQVASREGMTLSQYVLGAVHKRMEGDGVDLQSRIVEEAVKKAIQDYQSSLY